MGSIIVGTGMYVPDNVVTNHDLSRVMETTDDWITTRTGVKERRFVDPGTGTSDLAVLAAANALEDAGVVADEVDLLITATMTPDYIAPGIAGLVQVGLGLGHIASFDIRQQCSGFLYALDMADVYLSSGRARTVVVVGAEVHAGFLPWGQDTWAVLRGEGGSVGQEEYDLNTEHRAWSVLFGDGAGAMVLQSSTDDDEGILATSLHTDGAAFELIWVPGVGFKERPYVSTKTLERYGHLPVMDGGGLFRNAVRLMPEAAQAVLDQTGMQLDDLGLVIAHQANDRILEGVRRQFGMDSTKVPSNIAGYGNTTSATLPILYHEMRSADRTPAGSLTCFAAFGAGAHYGAALYREVAPSCRPG